MLILILAVQQVVAKEKTNNKTKNRSTQSARSKSEFTKEIPIQADEEDLEFRFEKTNALPSPLFYPERNRQWYYENIERVSEYNKKYREDNKEQLSESKNQWYQKNKTRLLLKAEKYREDNREKIRDYQKKYRAKNRIDTAGTLLI